MNKYITDSQTKQRSQRICVLATVPLSINTFYGKQFDFLKQNGFDVSVVTSADRGQEKNISSAVRVYIVPLTRKITPWQDCKTLWQIIVIMRCQHFDLVQYSSPKAALLGSIAAWMCRVPCRLYLMWGIYYVTQKGLMRFLLKTMERCICALSTDVSPDSKSNCDFAVQEKLCSREKISLAGLGSACGIDLERFNPHRYCGIRCEIRLKHGILSEDIVLGFVGRLQKDKGVNELIQSFAVLSNMYKNLYLLIVGSREFKKQGLLQDTQNILMSNTKIIQTGFQEKPEEFMSAMDIFVLPSYREGFGLVNIEASAMGLPVISTNIPGPRDSVIHNETGLLIEARSVEALTNGLMKLIDNEPLRRKMGNAGIAWAAKFEQKSHWKKIIEHRRALLEKRADFVFTAK